MIAFEELFPFGDLTRLLQQLQAEEKKLSSGRESFSQKYKETLKEEITLLAELKKQLAAVGSVSLKGDGLAKVGEEVDKVGKKVQGYRELINALTSAEAANEASVEKLRGTLAQLKAQYDKLDPTTAGFKVTQDELAQKSMYVKQAMDAQLSTLKTAVKTVKQAENSYAYLNTETGKLRNQLKNLPNAFDTTTGAINKHNKVAVDMLTQIQRNDRALKAMDASMGLHQRNVGNYKSAFDGLGSALVQFTGIAGGVDLVVTAITKSFEVIKTFDRYRSVIQFASKDTAEFNANLAFLEKIADSTGTEIEVLYKKYASFAIAAREANYTQKQTQAIFGSIIRAGGALKISNEGVELSLKAIEQMLSKGKISAEELRQQLGDHLPGAMQLFSKGLGISVEKLGEMMKAGQILSADALPKFAEQLDKTFGAAAQTNINAISGSFNRMTNQLKLLIDEFAQNTKVASFFSTLNNGLADALGGIRKMVNSDEWGKLWLIFGTFASNPVGAITLAMQRNAQAKIDERNFSMSAKGQVQNFKNTTPEEQQRIFNNQEVGAKNAKAEFDAMKETPYNKEKREELRKYANEQYAILNAYKQLMGVKKETTKVTKEETDEVKKMRKEYNALRNELKEATNKDKSYAKTDAGAAKLARYKELGAKLKDIDIAAGISSAPNEKIPDNAWEKKLKLLGREYDKMLNDIDTAINNHTEVPKAAIDSWKALYEATKAYADEIGVNIPDNFKSLNAKLFPKPIYEATALTPISTTTEMRGKKSPKNLEEMLSYAVSNSRMDDYINTVKKQGFEVAKLQESFSRSLRGLRKSERDELVSLKMQEMEFLKAHDEKRAAAAKAEFDANRERILTERDLRRESIAEVFSLTQTIGQGIFDIQNAYRDKEIEAINKKKDFELSLVQNNAVAQKAIEEDAANKIREIRVKQAKAEKAAALFNIALNTAQAVAKVWGQTGIFGLAAEIAPIAMGLVQAALVASKPIPEFAKGTQDAPEGPALVGEKGAELRKSGDKYYYYDKPTVTHLERGDKIFTATETARMFKDSMLSDRIERQQLNDTRGILSAMSITYKMDTTAIVDGMGKKFKEALSEQPYIKDVLDDDQIAKLMWRKGQLTKYYGKKHF